MMVMVMVVMGLQDITDLRLCLESGFLKGVPGDKIDPEQLRAVQSRFKLAKVPTRLPPLKPRTTSGQSG